MRVRALAVLVFWPRSLSLLNRLRPTLSPGYVQGMLKGSVLH